MFKKINRWLYGDHSYYITHVLIGIVSMACVWWLLIHVGFNQPICIVSNLISNDTINLAASLLGFQLAGVSVLISLDGNKKLCLLRKIESDTMIYKIFISSITMFMLSIILMLISRSLFVGADKSNIPRILFHIKSIIDYGSVATFFLGMIFLFSSIRLLKWLCAK